ncbi:unnamed protein product [Mytilus edulis]|uniref:Uncharacterized protein n=1 Tax=Mytilus edulis TaxID=6550 RepID=A0A8S3SPP2_MYTED|nr:unnamed protein product [Mytilus edulis]
MGSIANCTLSKRAEFLENISIAEPLKDSLLKSPLSDKMFGLPLQRVQEELSKNPPPVKVSVQVTNGKRSVNATSSSTSTSASGGPPSSAKKRKNNYGKPQNKPNNSGKSSVPISLSHTQDPVKCQLLSVEVDTMLQKAAIEEVSILTLFSGSKKTGGIYSQISYCQQVPFYQVPKKTGGMRGLTLQFPNLWKKSEIIPSQDFVFLGEHFLTSVGLVLPPEEKFTKLCQKIHLFLTVQSVTARQFLQLLGLLNSLADVIPLGRLHIRPLLVLSAQVMDCSFTRMGSIDSNHSAFISTPSMVVSTGKCNEGPMSVPSSSQSNIIHRCLHLGWGAYLRGLQSRESGVQIFWKSISMYWNESSSVCTESFPNVSKESVCHSGHGQHNSCSLSQESGGTHSPSLYQIARDILLLCFSNSSFGFWTEKEKIHAFSISDACLRFNRDKSSVTLLTDPAFWQRIRFQIKCRTSCDSCTPSDSISVLLCPVRILSIYLERTCSLRSVSNSRLFIPIKKGISDLSVKTISTWICKCISLAYGSSKAELLNSFNVKAHDVRGISTSWALFNSASLEEVLSAGFWRNENSFISHYLQSMATFAESLYSLGPIVSAQRLNFPPVSSVTGDSALR